MEDTLYDIQKIEIAKRMLSQMNLEQLQELEKGLVKDGKITVEDIRYKRTNGARNA